MVQFVHRKPSPTVISCEMGEYKLCLVLFYNKLVYFSPNPKNHAGIAINLYDKKRSLFCRCFCEFSEQTR